jgi:hypothetical protein
LAGPDEKAANPLRLCGPASSSTVTVPCEKVTLGASFTGVTVIVKVFVTASTPPLTVPPLSCTTTVISAVPLASGTGVYFNVPVAFGFV